MSQQLTVNQVTKHMICPLYDWDQNRGEDNPEGMRYLVRKEFDILPDQPFIVENLASQIDELVLKAKFVTDDGRVLVGFSAHSAYGETFRPRQKMGFFILGGEMPLSK